MRQGSHDLERGCVRCEQRADDLQRLGAEVQVQRHARLDQVGPGADGLQQPRDLPDRPRDGGGRVARREERPGRHQRRQAEGRQVRGRLAALRRDRRGEHRRDHRERVLVAAGHLCAGLLADGHARGQGRGRSGSPHHRDDPPVHGELSGWVVALASPPRSSPVPPCSPSARSRASAPRARTSTTCTCASRSWPRRCSSGWRRSCCGVVRYRKRDDLPAPQGAGSGRIIGIFFAIPTVIIAVLFPFGEQTLSYVQHRDKHPDVTINADAFQWEWTFTYINEGLVETGKTLVKPAVMEVPVNQTVHIHLQSRDVMHEFYVPALLFMRNAIPGHPNDFDFTPTKLGTYPGQCAEFCGLWHSKMTFVLKVVSPAEYSAWIQSEKAAALNVSCPPGPPAVQLTAQNTTWNTACIAVKPGTPWSVTVVNKDAGIDHTFGVFDSNKLKVKYFLSPPVAGPSSATFQLVPLRPGRYYFECTIHGPSMSGALIVR